MAAEMSPLYSFTATMHLELRGTEVSLDEPTQTKFVAMIVFGVVVDTTKPVSIIGVKLRKSCCRWVLQQRSFTRHCFFLSNCSLAMLATRFPISE